MAKAGVEGAILNVKINIGSIKDEEFVKKTTKELKEIEQNTDEKTKNIMKYVEGNL